MAATSNITALGLIKRSLKDIGVLEGGEEPPVDIALDSLDMLNDMLDSWSTEEQMIYNYTEIVFTTQTDTIQYTLGVGGNVNAQIVGSITENILTISQVIQGNITFNMVLQGAGLPNGIHIVDFISGNGGNDDSTLGTYELSDYVASTITGQFTGYYQRPLKIDYAFVRVSYSLNNQTNFGQYIDYPVTVLTTEQYKSIGIKSLPGPWVKFVYYNPAATLGNLYVFPNPGIGELHLWCQTLFTQFPSLNTNIDLLQGYTMALRWSLAELLMPMFGKSDPAQVALVTSMARKYRGQLKRMNANPVGVMRFDEQLINAKVRDAGFVLHGGFL